MAKKKRKRSSREWAAIHASNSKPQITFNDSKESKHRVVGTKHTMNVSSKRFSNDAEHTELQKIKDELQQSILSKRILNKITPDTVELSAGIPEGVNLKVTWHPKE